MPRNRLRRLSLKGGRTYTQWAVATPKRHQIMFGVATADEAQAVVADRQLIAMCRQVTTWPDGTTLTRPWRPLDAA